jgi:O-antigen/teichoic acid export membrane protein
MPLYRNGYALVASSALSSALGLVYWLVAAREYSPAAVGVSAALISAMTLLANLSQLNLKSGLNRFLPRAGAGSARFVTRSYLLALAVAALASLVFVAGLGIWSPQLGFLGDRPELALWFAAATMAWTIFVLQDSVFAGIRQAGWVPVENLAYALLKIFALFAVVAVTPTLGAFVAWTAPLLLLVVPVNLLLFRRLIPRHVRATRGREQPAPAWRVARYVAADYAAYLIMAATIGVLPLIVLGALGAEANAYYFVSWSIAYALYLISSDMGTAMISEASLDPGRLGAYSRRALAETARLVVPAVAIVVVGAPAILGLLGDSYSREAVTLLRLLALSAVPWVIVAWYTNVARVQRRMRAVIGTHAVLCGLVLALGLPLIGTLGIGGLGVAWLGAQSIVAAAIVIAQLTRGSRREWEEQALRALSSARVWMTSWWRRLCSTGALRTILQTLSARRPERSGWGVRGHLRVLNDVALTKVGPPRNAAAALVKRARSDAAERSLRRQERMLVRLHWIPGLDSWARLVPGVLASGTAAGRRFVVETCMPGVTCERLLRDGKSPGELLVTAEAAIRPLHEATRTVASVDEGLLNELVDAPLVRLLPAVVRRSKLVRAETALQLLANELRAGLAGARVVTSHVHGDFCPGNILMSGDGSSVDGIIDWDQARERGLPQLDLVHLLITTRMVVEQRELGEVVTGLLRDLDWQAPERPLARAIAARDPSLAAPTRTLVLLAWLQHVGANVDKAPRYARSRLWVRRNVDPVLAVVLRGRATAPAGAVALPELSRPRPTRWRERLAAARASIGAARLELGAFLGVLSLAVVMWVHSLGSIDPRAMSDTGLISVLPLTFYAALLVLTASFAALVHRCPKRSSLLGVHLLALVAFLHATPAIVYGTLRYSWAWKHVGIVDYIERHGGVAPGIDYLGVYHNWPGFFGLDALLTDVAGLGDTLELASWGPLFFNVLNLAALVFLFSALTRDKRVVWLGAWLFFSLNWVAQDYFSPQAFAFFLFLVVLGIVLRWLGPAGDDAFARGDRPRRAALVALVVLLLVAIAVSHALTAVMVTVALAALVLFRLCAVRSLPFIAAAITVLWDTTFAWDFVSRNAQSALERVRLPWATTESSLVQVGQLGDAQALVAGVSRMLVVVAIALAVTGVLTQLRGRRLNKAAVVLALAPLLLFASGNYDGEILFRIYLFGVPFLAFLGAHALVGLTRLRLPSWGPVVVSAEIAAFILAGFLFAYYGNERQHYFTPSEVAAARYLYTHAPPGAFLIEGTHNYPAQFKNYERYDYLTLAQEPGASQARFLSRPAAVLSEWMNDRSPRAAFLIITRSQKAEVDEVGVMPPRSLDRIERALRSSSRFETVLRNRDATIFTLAGATTGRSSR